MELIRNILISFFIIVTITTLIIVLAYVNVEPSETMPTAETTEVYIEKVETK